MGQFAVGSVVLVTFPFSNLKGTKVRPALVLAQVEFDNLVLCQITSKPYSSKSAIIIEKKDFIEGELPIRSYARPDKLFTADISIIKRKAGELKQQKIASTLRQVIHLFKS